MKNMKAFWRNLRRVYEIRDGRGYINWKWIPAGPQANVKGTFVKNPKIRLHIEKMHTKWLLAKAGLR